MEPKGTTLAYVSTDAVVYCRLSLDKTGEELGVTRQLEDCRRLAEQRGWRIVDEAVDNDTSAAGKANRPGFEKALKHLADGTATVVIAWSLDRLTRNRRDTVRIIEVGQAAEAIISLVRGTDLDLSTASGRMVADVLASVARSEIEVKSERQKRSIQQAVEAGRRVAGQRAFGFTLTMEPFEPEATAVRDAYAMILAGQSLRAVAREWNRRGLLTPQIRNPKGPGTGSPWRGAIVSKTLRKHCYAGLRSHLGVEVRTTREDGKAAWAGLVSEDVWRGSQAVLNDPSRRSGHGAQALLTGVALCYVCGHTLISGGQPKGSQRAYRCGGSQGHIKRMAEPVENYIETILKLWLQRPEVRKRLLADAKAGPDLRALTVERDGKRKKLDAIAEQWSDGILTDSQLRTATLRTKAALTDLDAKIATMSGQSLLAPFLVGDVDAVWDDADTEIKRKVINRLMTLAVMPPGRGVRTFDPASVVARWRF